MGLDVLDDFIHLKSFYSLSHIHNGIGTFMLAKHHLEVRYV